MKRELGVRQPVGIPVTTAWTPSDVDVSIDLVEPDLDAVELSGFPAASGDVDGAVACQGVLYPLVHPQSPVRFWTCSSQRNPLTFQIRSFSSSVIPRRAQKSRKASAAVFAASISNTPPLPSGVN
jgi:hypothetical protein